MLRTADAVAAEASHLVPIYQMAFAEAPWGEVSQCVAPPGFEKACPSRRSPQGVDETCTKCGEILLAPAFSRQALTDGWIDHFENHDSRFYLEQLDDGSCLLAALAWRATPETLADRCYSDPSEREMRAWLASELPGSFVWLEDIFAHRVLRPRRNLWNYRGMIAQLLAELDSSVLVFRSINPRLIEKTLKTFDSEAERLENVPDRRDVVLVRLAK